MKPTVARSTTLTKTTILRRGQHVVIQLSRAQDSVMVADVPRIAQGLVEEAQKKYPELRTDGAYITGGGKNVRIAIDLRGLLIASAEDEESDQTPEKSPH